MPENPANLHVVGVTQDGAVKHTIRSPGAWTPFDVISGPPPRAVDVACVRRLPIAPEAAFTEGLWMLIAFEDAPPQLKFRNADSGQITTIPGNILPLPIARHVAVTVSPGRAPANDPFDPGGARSYVHLVVIADGVPPQGDRGRLIAAIMPNRGAGGVSSAIAEVQTSGAGDLGPAAAVALAPAPSVFLPPDRESVAELGAAFDDGALFFTSGGVSASGTTGRWDPFRARDLLPPRGPGGRPGNVSDVALVNDVNPTQTAAHVGIVRAGVDPDIYGATNQGGAWSAWENFEVVKFPFVTIDADPGNFSSVTMGTTTEGLHVLGTIAGQIFHQLRTPAAPGTAIFRDVEQVGVGQEAGFFVEVACG